MRSNMLKVEIMPVEVITILAIIMVICMVIGTNFIIKGIQDLKKEQEYINYAIQDSKMQHENLM